MDYDIVIATRNRDLALQVSLPLMLAQRRLPRRLIVVDSSDDHGRIRRTVEKAAADARARGVVVDIIRSDPGSSYQRNIGLRSVGSPVVFFPDDDALWFPGYPDAVMRIYERDTEELVGGVGGVESTAPPPGVLDKSMAYRMEMKDRVQLLIGRFLDSIEFRFFPDPFFIETAIKYGNKQMPSWLHEEDSKPATVIPGFRMSFRTELIKRTGFDEALGRYAIFEDYDASLEVMKSHILVDAMRAKVFHYRSPEKRVNGFEWGFIQILNRAYVICKHSPPGSLSRRRLRGFSCYKLIRYLAQAQTWYGRQRVRGLLKALLLISQFYSAPDEELKQIYVALRESALVRSATI
ncbi:MAG: Glycosyl transferase family 2 [Syntrophorhabdaceae bacterium PtaU1.Bin034]|nr:MAG: Glycosyl transferase family 2 [Syntrophorhabdaceae bacterium PtaU1.Bin034]